MVALEKPRLPADSPVLLCDSQYDALKRKHMASLKKSKIDGGWTHFQIIIFCHRFLAHIVISTWAELCQDLHQQLCLSQAYEHSLSNQILIWNMIVKVHVINSCLQNIVFTSSIVTYDFRLIIIYDVYSWKCIFWKENPHYFLSCFLSFNIVILVKSYFLFRYLKSTLG